MLFTFFVVKYSSYSSPVRGLLLIFCLMIEVLSLSLMLEGAIGAGGIRLSRLLRPPPSFSWYSGEKFGEYFGICRVSSYSSSNSGEKFGENFWCIWRLPPEELSDREEEDEVVKLSGFTSLCLMFFKQKILFSAFDLLFIILNYSQTIEM